MKTLLLSILITTATTSRAGCYENPEALQEFPAENTAEQYAMGESNLEFGQKKPPFVYLHYIEPYGIKELSSRKMGLLLSAGKTRHQQWELFYKQTGDESWREHHIGIGASILAAPGLKFGIRTTILLLEAANGIKGHAYVPEIEGSYEPDRKTTFGIRLINPTQSRLKTEGRSVKYTFTAHGGVEYKQNPFCRFRIESGWHINQPVRLGGGFEYLFLRKIALRCGYHTQPATPTWGIGFPYKRTAINYGSSLHTILGFSHSISIAYSWK